jgi:polysaccharide biosynthesis protein PslE
MNQEPSNEPTRNGSDPGHAQERFMASTDEAPGLRDFLTVLFKRKRVMLVTFLTIVATVTVVTLLLPPTYEAEAKLLVRAGRENVYRPEVGGNQNQVLSFNNEEVINSETGILTSRDLIAKVVSSLTVERLYPDLAKTPRENGEPLDAAVKRFGEDLAVEGLRKSNIIQLRLRHEDPRMAAMSLARLVDYFKEKHLQAYSDPQSSYLEEQLAAYEQRLKQSQDRLEAYKQRNHVFSLEEQRTLLLTQRAGLDSGLKATQNQVRELQRKISSVTGLLQTVSPRVPLSTETERYRSLDAAKSQLLTLQLKEQDLLRKFTESNPLVVSARRELEIVRTFISREEQDVQHRMQTGQNVVYLDLERELNRLQAELPSQQARAASLGSQIAQLDLQIPNLDMSEMALENLKRDVAVNDRNYRTYLEKVEDARILDDLNRQKSTSISVIQEATAPVEPVRPRKLLNIALGVILGALAALGLAFVTEFSAQSLSSPGSVERVLGLPVLTTISLKR